jgi:hypothetical protein
LIQAKQAHPLVNAPKNLAGGQVAADLHAAGEEPIVES